MEGAHAVLVLTEWEEFTRLDFKCVTLRVRVRVGVRSWARVRVSVGVGLGLEARCPQRREGLEQSQRGVRVVQDAASVPG